MVLLGFLLNFMFSFLLSFRLSFLFKFPFVFLLTIDNTYAFCKNSKNVFCTQDRLWYPVETILLGRYEGSGRLKGFHIMDLGEELNAKTVMSCIR